MNRTSRLLLIVIVMALGTSRSAGSATLQVASAGLDGPTCGVSVPCRSISRAIENALPGDTVLVGAGIYSPDLDHDGVPNEPGEEPTTGLGNIVVHKAVQVLSRFGASSTVLRAALVNITAGGVVFGKLNQGFTFATAGNAILIGAAGSVRVGGNVVLVDVPQGPAGIIGAGTRLRLEHNRILARQGCSIGILLLGVTNLVTRNTVIGCDTGFSATGGADGVRLVRNTAIGNASGNPNGRGFALGGNVIEFSGNVAIGNGTGVFVDSPVSAFQNNAFAANETNCGVRNASGGLLNATNNWWGAPTGPGSDPADTFCNDFAGITLATPFLTSDPTRGQAALR